MDLTTVFNAGLIFLGAVSSWMVGQILPNARRKKELEQRLADMSASTADLTGQIDPLLAVLLRTERLRLEERRRGLKPIQPSFRAYADALDARSQSLAKRVAVARQLDRVTLLRNNWLSGSANLAAASEIGSTLREISLLLSQRDVRDAEIDDASSRLAKVASALSATAPGAEASPRLRDSFESLRAYFETSVLDSAVQQAADCLPALFSALREGDDNAARDKFELWWKGVGDARAEIQLAGAEAVRAYDLLRKGGSPFDDARMSAIHAELLTALKLPSLDGALRLRALMRQSAQGIFVDDILDEIRGGRIQLEIDPPKVFANWLIRFSVRFQRPDMNGAAAREALQCVWTFPDGSGGAVQISGWTVARYFPGVGSHDVKVEFLQPNGLPVEGAGLTATVQSNAAPRAHWISPQGWLELVQFLIALIIPIAAITATAQTSVSGWSLFILGFTSDKIKEAIAGGGSRQTP